jgi:hypothetical protein
MAFKDLREGILSEFAERATTTMAYEMRTESLHIDKREENSRKCAARQRELRRDPIVGDAYREKLAAARREYRARMKARAA